jgi:hypothetical protein
LPFIAMYFVLHGLPACVESVCRPNSRVKSGLPRDRFPIAVKVTGFAISRPSYHSPSGDFYSPFFIVANIPNTRQSISLLRILRRNRRSSASSGVGQKRASGQAEFRPTFSPVYPNSWRAFLLLRTRSHSKITRYHPPPRSPASAPPHRPRPRRGCKSDGSRRDFARRRAGSRA